MATAAFVESFSESPVAWPMAPIMATLRFYGLSVLVLVVSALAQQASGTSEMFSDNVLAAVAAADPSGFGAVAAHYEAKAPSSHAAGHKMFTTFSRVLLENCAQLWLQSSFFAIVRSPHCDGQVQGASLSGTRPARCHLQVSSGDQRKRADLVRSE